MCSLVSATGTISVNTLRTPYTAPGESEILDLDDELYLGGLPENKAGLVFPTEVWTALLNYGYVGCIRDLFIDGQSKDIRQMAEIQSTAGVKPSCSRETAKPCLSNPCKNNGMCRDGWNRYVCDCSGTGYLGRSCERGRIPKTKPLTPLRWKSIKCWPQTLNWPWERKVCSTDVNSLQAKQPRRAHYWWVLRDFQRGWFWEDTGWSIPQEEIFESSISSRVWSI